MHVLRLALASLALAPLASGQAWDQHLTPGTTDARLPSGLDITDTVLAFGQPRFDRYNDPQIEDIVRVFELQGADFVEVAALQSSLVPATSASFGVAIALEGDWLAIGDPNAPGTGFVTGAVHIYHREVTGWEVYDVIQPQIVVGLSVLEFGKTLDIENGRLAVGAPTSTVFEGGLEDGAVYIFELQAGVWTEVQQLAAPGSVLFGHFGRDLELDGDRLIVGHPGGDPLIGPHGLARIYDYDGSAFVHDDDLIPANGTGEGGFGMTVTLEGSVAAVGAPGAHIVNHSDGRVHVFEESGGSWTEVDTLEDVNARPYNSFGGDVELESGALFVSSENTASAQRFEPGPGGWEKAERYTTAVGFAYAPVVPVRLRARGSRVVITDSEGATVFERNVPAKLEIGCEGAALPGGTPALTRPVILDTRGEQRMSEPDLTFVVVPSAQIGPGLLFYGFSPANIPFAGGSTLCIGPPHARADVAPAPSGTFFTSPVLDLQNYPVASGPNSFGAGTTVYFQYWFRVPGGGSFLSSSLELEFAP